MEKGLGLFSQQNKNQKRSRAIKLKSNITNKVDQFVRLKSCQKMNLE